MEPKDKKIEKTAEELAAASTAAPETSDATASETTTTETKSFTVEDLVGKEHKEIVAGLRKLKEYTDFPMMKVTNITIRGEENDESSKQQMTVVVSRNLPAFQEQVIDGQAVWAEGTNRNLYVAAFQIAALLKESGETAFAKHISENPGQAAFLLEGARVSCFSKFYAAGEEECNPWASKQSGYIFPHDSYRNYVYAIELGATGKALKMEMLRAKAMQMLG